MLQIIRDLERVTCDSQMRVSTKTKLRELSPKVYRQAYLEKGSNTRLRNSMKELNTTGSLLANCIVTK